MQLFTTYNFGCSLTTNAGESLGTTVDHHRLRPRMAAYPHRACNRQRRASGLAEAVDLAARGARVDPLPGQILVVVPGAHGLDGWGWSWGAGWMAGWGWPAGAN